MVSLPALITSGDLLPRRRSIEWSPLGGTAALEKLGVALRPPAHGSG